jgi:hypothetical protein
MRTKYWRSAKWNIPGTLTPIVFLGLSAAWSVQAQIDPNLSVSVVQGRLFDSTSGEPVAAAMVELSAGDLKQAGSTDSNGAFSFLVPLGNNGGDADILVTANLYHSAHLSVRIDRGKPTVVNVGLVPKPASEIALVHGTLTNSDNGQGIPDAIVTILGAGDALSTTTGPNGSFSIDRVGFNPNLNIQITTSTAPCIASVVRPLAVNATTVVADIATSTLKIPVVHCPFNQFGPGAGGKTSTLPSDQNVQWHQADVLSIQINANADAWHAGHVNDILKFEPGGGLLAATDTGGVWSITSIGQSFPLSDSWSAMNMMALAAGPDGPRHVYAGTQPRPFGATRGGVLWETDTSTIIPIFNWRQVNPKPPCGLINRILVISEARRIVLACDSGLYWSRIPAPPSAQGTYAWIDATPANVQQGRSFSGLAKGPGWSSTGGEGTIIVSKWGGYAPLAAIYNGLWFGGQLLLSPSRVDQGVGNLFLSIGRSSLASCSSDPQQMFAVAEDGLNNLAGVWRSADGGELWSLVTLPPNPGQQGSYNNAIAVSADCRIVAVGWQAGTFLSYDRGGSWNLLSSPDGHLHGDVHALTFDPSDPTTLFIGSDGGVASASALGPASRPTFTSNWNRQLFNLQFYHGAASPAASGLVAGGLQDNGVVWAGLPGPWQHLTDCGCDGRWSLFLKPPNLAPGNSILLDEEFGAPDWPFGWVIANGNSIHNATQDIPVSPPNPPVLKNAQTAIVRFPGGHANAHGQTMFGAGGMGTQVYGLFANDDGSDLHWEPLGQIGGGQNVSVISSDYNGRSLFVGTDQGNIYRLDAPYTQTALQLSINAPSEVTGNGAITGLAGFFSTLAYATVNYGGSDGNGYVMFWNGQSWNSVGSNLPHDLPFFSIAARDINNVFVGSEVGVYDTHDGGNTWNQASNGLPNIVNVGELRIVTEPSGTTYLYLATFGRSLWRTPLP